MRLVTAAGLGAVTPAVAIGQLAAFGAVLLLAARHARREPSSVRELIVRLELSIE